MQRVPKDLTHRALGKTHEQHVPSLPSDGILKIGEGKEEEWHKNIEHIPFSISKFEIKNKARGLMQ